jgi:hypothetical protein
MTPAPRRRSDWVQTILTGLVLTAVGYGAQGLTGLKENVSALNLKVARLETTIQVGMTDRFTGQEGEALEARVKLCERTLDEHEGRLDALDQWSAEVRGRNHNRGTGQ